MITISGIADHDRGLSDHDQRNTHQAQKMKAHGLFRDVHDEVGQIIVADVSADGVKALLAADRARLGDLIQQKYP